MHINDIQVEYQLHNTNESVGTKNFTNFLIKIDFWSSELNGVWSQQYYLVSKYLIVNIV